MICLTSDGVAWWHHTACALASASGLTDGAVKDERGNSPWMLHDVNIAFEPNTKAETGAAAVA